MSNQTEAVAINQWLKQDYGTSIEGHVRFRVIWTTGLTEKRKGIFNEHTEGGIFLRTLTGVQTVLKYPYHQDRWVLEEIYYLNAKDNEVADQLVENRWGYEGIYYFQDKDCNYLPLHKDVIEVLLYFKQNLDLFTGPNRKNQIADEINDREKARRERIKQILGERQSWFGAMDLV